MRYYSYDWFIFGEAIKRSGAESKNYICKQCFVDMNNFEYFYFIEMFNFFVLQFSRIELNKTVTKMQTIKMLNANANAHFSYQFDRDIMNHFSCRMVYGSYFPFIHSTFRLSFDALNNWCDYHLTEFSENCSGFSDISIASKNYDGYQI